LITKDDEPKNAKLEEKAAIKMALYDYNIDRT